MATARCTEPSAAGSPCLRAGTPGVTNTARRQGNHGAAPPPLLAGEKGAGRGAGRRAGRSAKARPFLNFAPVAVEPAERLERTHRQSPPGTSFREKERGVHVPSASVRFAAAQNLLWEPPPGEPPTAPASGIPLGSPRVLQRGCCLGSAPDFPGWRAARLGPRRPVAWVTRESAPGRVHLGAAAFRGAREPGGHLYAVPREDRRPPVSPAAAVALEAEPSRAAQRPRHEAQLHPATEGL